MITVVTPTYNRAHTLERPFRSLQKQTNKSFTWIIIDDGSTDNTKQMVDQFKQEALFPIEYHYKENGGRHTALNESYQYIKTKYVVNLDSDDEFVEDAIQKMLDTWASVPKDKYDSYWCVVGRCIDSKTGELVGNEFPLDINEMKFGYKKAKRIFQVRGEKSCCRKADILTQYPFPVYEDTKFVTENIVWEKIANTYDQWCTNEIFRVYYQNEPDSLCANNRIRSRSNMCSAYHYAVFCLNENIQQFFYNNETKKNLINVTRYGFLAGKELPEIIKDIHKIYMKIIVFCFSPVSYACYLRERKWYQDE